MPWFKVDDGFHGHPKVIELSLESVGLWTLAGSWCASYLTDGVIGLKIVRRLGGDSDTAEELVRAGLWLPCGRDKYEFKDWADYQPLKAAVEQEREAAQERMRKLRAGRKGIPKGDSSREVHSNTDASSDDVQANNAGTFADGSEEVQLPRPFPSPSHPDPALKESRVRDDFIDWYAAYPRKESKVKAETAYVKARKTVDAETLLRAAERYRDDPNRDPQFTKTPPTWLNQGCWDDDPLPPRSGQKNASDERMERNLQVVRDLMPTDGMFQLGGQ